MSNRAEVLTGAKASIPVALAYVPLGMAFGVLAVEVGLSAGEATMMSALVFTGAGQYIAIGLLAAGGSGLTIILANLLVNLRYFLFSTSLVPYLRNIPTGTASALMLGLTDETYAVASVHFRENSATTPYLSALNLTAYLSWVLSTLLGANIGHLIPDTDQLGLNFALPAMYTILLILVINERRHLMAAIISVIVCLLTAILFPVTLTNLSNVILAAVVASTVGVMIKK